MSPIYRIKPGWCPADPNKAQAYGERIEYLDTLSEVGSASVRDVVNDAKDPQSILHDVFEWDDSVAGEKYRLQQARLLLNHLVVVVKDQEVEEVRARFSVTTPSGDNVYAAFQTVQDTPDYQQQIIDQALKQLRIWQKKYSMYQVLSGITLAIEEALSSLP